MKILPAFQRAALAFSILAASVSGSFADGDRPHAGNRVHAPRVVVKMRRVSVPRPQPIVHPEHIVYGRPNAPHPVRDGAGVVIVKPMAVVPPAHHGVVLGNAALVGTILGLAAAETVANHYYWHTDNGVKYAHYYDGHAQWYGFYHGTTFYWTQYRDGRWWWHDDRFGRWVYWYNGQWWWQAPNGASYVYMNNNYYPYEAGGVVTVQTPEMVAPPASNPLPNEGKTSVSADRTRMVQIFGPRSEAFLYDETTGNPAFLKYLGENVTDARFSGGSGQPLQVLLDYKDGNFAIFDANGDSMAATPAPSDVAPGAVTEAQPEAPMEPSAAPAPDGGAPPDAGMPPSGTPPSAPSAPPDSGSAPTGAPGQ